MQAALARARKPALPPRVRHGVDTPALVVHDPGMDFDAEANELEQVWRAHMKDEDPREQIARWRSREPDTEIRLAVPSVATQRVLVAVCALYNVRPYRRPRQQKSTVCLEVPASFMDVVLEPLLRGMAQVVERAVEQTTVGIIERWSEQHGGEAPRASTQRAPSTS